MQEPRSLQPIVFMGEHTSVHEHPSQPSFRDYAAKRWSPGPDSDDAATGDKMESTPLIEDDIPSF